MTQHDDEIKQKTISRNFKSRDILSEAPHQEVREENPEELLANRREMLTGLLPTLGKGLANMMREVSMRVAEVMEKKS